MTAQPFALTTSTASVSFAGWTLTSGHRCWNCGGRAYVRVTKPDGTELLFCEHHGNLMLPAFEALTGFKILDERAALDDHQYLTGPHEPVQRSGDPAMTAQPTTSPTTQFVQSTSTAVKLLPLVAADRGDCCGARALMRVVLGNGSELLFCGHHGDAQTEALRAKGAKIYDASGQLIQA